jgi:Tol biopolymer transport system component
MTISLLKEKFIQPTSSFKLSNFNACNGDTTASVTSGIVFIDSTVDDYEMLMAGVKPGLEVVLLDDSQDGITQITQSLKGRTGLSSLHIVTHGDAGELWVGIGFVNSHTLEQYKHDLQSWAAALAPDGDILLYGCNVAAGETGRQFVQRFSQLTGADVAASSNLTGSAALGGDWELEVKIGLVEAPIAFQAETVEAYHAVLAIRRVSVSTDGTEGNYYSSRASISADGRYVAFDSGASNLVSDDTNSSWDIFVYDRASNTTRRVSVASDGIQGNNSSSSLSISADGRYVAFSSIASNLVSGDTGNYGGIFVYDTVANTTRRVSLATDGTQGNDYSGFPSLSADGRYVAFESYASNLVSGDTNNASDIFVYDTVANTTRRVSVASDGTQGNNTSYSSSISADGRYVAFYSDASNLVSGDTNNAGDIFVYDTVANTTRRVSVASDGTQGNSSSGKASISTDGRYVAFESAASNLVSGDTNNAGDIFVYDTVANTTRRVSVASDGTQGNNNSFFPSISADGRYLAFHSVASNLVSDDTNGRGDIFVYDTVANTTRLVSVATDGPQGNGDSYYPSISADGSYVAFISDASNLVSGDTNNVSDIFVYDLGYGTQNPWTGTPFDDTYTYTGTANFTGNGLAGNDTIVGGIGNDTIVGGIGNDTLDGGTGNDSLVGGLGNDTYYVDSYSGDKIVENLNEGIDTVISSQRYLLGNNLENLTLTGTATQGIGNSLDNVITGNSGANNLQGRAGNDTILGEAGNDNLNGNDGNDRLYGGDGNDTLVGERGSDFLWGANGNDLLVGYGNTSGEIDTLVGGAGSDTFGVGVNYAYFGGGSGGLIGYTDDGNAGYALIRGWESTDFIELKGDISQYTFGSENRAGMSTLDTTIYYNGTNGLDLIGVVQDQSISATSSTFIFFT